MKILYLGTQSIMCQGIFHILTMRFPDDEVSLFPIDEIRTMAPKQQSDIIIMNCESIEQRPDLLAPVRGLSGMKTPVLGLSTNSHLFHHLYRELPAFRGLIDQESSVEFFISAIRIVAAGGFCYSWNVLESGSDINEEMYEKAGLTRREREILKLCQSGESNKAISIRLSRSEKTISAHKSNILRKLGMKSSQLIHGAQPLNAHADK